MGWVMFASPIVFAVLLVILDRRKTGDWFWNREG